MSRAVSAGVQPSAGTAQTVMVAGGVAAVAVEVPVYRNEDNGQQPARAAAVRTARDCWCPSPHWVAELPWVAAGLPWEAGSGREGAGFQNG
jgi:hypothetical protein